MIFIDNNLLTSQAFNQLEGYSVRVLIWFLMKRKLSRHKDSNGNVGWRITNNGELVLTYTEAEKRDMSRKRFSRAIKDLIGKGFLEVTRQGSGPGSPSTYLLTESWQSFGTAHFKPALDRKNKN
jgi:hypothetical protein